MAIPRPEAEIAALLDSPDAVFFSELGSSVTNSGSSPARAALLVLSQAEFFTPRRCSLKGGCPGAGSCPFAELEHAIPQARVVGSVYRSLADK